MQKTADQPCKLVCALKDLSEFVVDVLVPLLRRILPLTPCWSTSLDGKRSCLPFSTKRDSYPYPMCASAEDFRRPTTARRNIELIPSQHFTSSSRCGWNDSNTSLKFNRRTKGFPKLVASSSTQLNTFCFIKSPSLLSGACTSVSDSCALVAIILGDAMWLSQRRPAS